MRDEIAFIKNPILPFDHGAELTGQPALAALADWPRRASRTIGARLTDRTSGSGGPVKAALADPGGPRRTSWAVGAGRAKMARRPDGSGRPDAGLAGQSDGPLRANRAGGTVGAWLADRAGGPRRPDGSDLAAIAGGARLTVASVAAWLAGLTVAYLEQALGNVVHQPLLEFDKLRAHDRSGLAALRLHQLKFAGPSLAQFVNDHRTSIEQHVRKFGAVVPVRFVLIG
jgi:hypothetical protein